MSAAFDLLPTVGFRHTRWQLTTDWKNYILWYQQQNSSNRVRISSSSCPFRCHAYSCI